MKYLIVIGMISVGYVATPAYARMVPFENCYPYQRVLKISTNDCVKSLQEKHHLRVTVSRHHCLLMSGERVLKRVPKLMQADRRNAKKQLSKLCRALVL